MKKIGLIVITLFLLFLSSFSVLSADSGLQCLPSFDDCPSYLGPDSYCDPATYTCFIPDSPITGSDATTDVNASVPEISNITTIPVADATAGEIQNLQGDFASLSADLIITKNDIIDLKNQVSNIQQNLAQINTNLNINIQNVNSQLSTVSTGLAGLQTNLNSTQEQLSGIKNDLEKRQRNSAIITTILILVIIAGAGWAAYYFIIKPSPARKGKVNHQAMDYITGHIKQGIKFPQIKTDLLRSGWQEEDIMDAYKETMRRNYQEYKKNKFSSAPLTSPGTIQEASGGKNKMVGIVAVSVILLIGIILLLSSTTGQAIFFKQNFEHKAPFECTPPHIQTYGGCCLDENSNGVCDTEEEYAANKSSTDAQVCDDHNQCSRGKICIDNKCGVLYSLYNTNCTRKCNFNDMDFLTSDGESYNLFERGKGSYTAAGALEWRVLPGPNYCEGDEAIVPVEFIKKGPETSVNEAGVKQTDIKVLSKKIITLRKGQASKMITHPQIKSINFSLTLQDYNEVCFEG